MSESLRTCRSGYTNTMQGSGQSIPSTGFRFSLFGRRVSRITPPRESAKLAPRVGAVRRNSAWSRVPFGSASSSLRAILRIANPSLSAEFSAGKFALSESKGGSSHPLRSQFPTRSRHLLRSTRRSIDDAILHHKVDLLQKRDVGQGISGHGDQVGELARLDGTNLVRCVQHLRCNHRG